MSMLTQGTQIYFIDDSGSDTDVVEVECATTFNPGGAPADQLEDTCLADSNRSYKAGLRTPGQATLGINTDVAMSSHLLMHELSQTDPSPVLKWVVGFSDGTVAPTVDASGDFELPTTRSWFPFQGYIADFPLDFSLNTLVASQVSIQRSGGSDLIKKSSS